MFVGALFPSRFRITACTIARPGFITDVAVCHAGFATTTLASVFVGGTWSLYSAPAGLTEFRSAHTHEFSRSGGLMSNRRFVNSLAPRKVIKMCSRVGHRGAWVRTRLTWGASSRLRPKFPSVRLKWWDGRQTLRRLRPG